MKQAIVQELGGVAVFSPEKIAASLSANDHVKYYFALLQSARDNADRPRVPAVDLKCERLASKVPDSWLDDVVAGTRKDNEGCYRLPRGADILRRIETSVAAMLSCLPDAERKPLEVRASALALPAFAADSLPGSLISQITSGNRKTGDSLHLVVMDAHRAINRLQAATAIEILAGARTLGLTDLGRRRVSAFMSGLNRTAPLKFDHPGLDTTAMEHQGHLLIQNDIGTTDAHVLMVRVDGREATLTYTDIHPARLHFFKALFKDHTVIWSATEERRSEKLQSAEYMLATGRFVAETEADLEDYLRHLGSRIVFLIDWNKMRKRLRLFVGKAEAIHLLTWAAQNDYGHRALLEVGGERLLAEAVEYVAGTALRYGQRLDEMISADRACAFLKDSLRLAATGLQARRSRRSIGDEIKAVLRTYFERERLAVFDLAADHAAIGYDLALALLDRSVQLDRTPPPSDAPSLGERAKTWEMRADLLLNDVRADITRFARSRRLVTFMEHCDDAVDELEEAVSLFDLTQGMKLPAAAVRLLSALAEQALAASQEMVKCIECAATITRSDVRDDLDDFIVALERLMSIEHTADDLLRDMRRLLIAVCNDARQIMVLRDLSRGLESATDAYVHAAHELRTYLMEEVIA